MRSFLIRHSSAGDGRSRKRCGSTGVESQPRDRELGLAGQAAVSSDYDWEPDAAELKNLYCEIFSLQANA
jgi:hypothetical protein